MKKSQTTREDGLAMVSLWKSSGKSIREFCEEQNTTYHRLHYWHGVYKRAQGGERPKPDKNKFIPITLKSGDPTIPSLEIRTPAGYSIIVFQSVNLTELISLLK